MYLCSCIRSFVSLHTYEVRTGGTTEHRTHHGRPTAARCQKYYSISTRENGPVRNSYSVHCREQTTCCNYTYIRYGTLYRSLNVNDRRRTAGHPTISFRLFDHRSFSRFWLWEDLRPTKPRLVVPVKRTEETNNEREFGIAQNSQGIS